MPRKSSVIRQLSLQCDSPPSQLGSRRSSLKKVASEEETIGIRISLSGKAIGRTPNSQIKLAWGDPDVAKNADTLIDRSAWKECEKNAESKLKIFLQHCQSQMEQSDTSDVENVPKITLPLIQPDGHETARLKHIFQKHLRKSSHSASPRGSAAPGNHSNAMIVIPLIDRPSLSPTVGSETDTQPPTAAQRRANFKNRTSSAFQAVCHPSNNANRQFRPPLVRASSLPSKPTEQKGKFPRKPSKPIKRYKVKSDCDQDKKSADVVTMVSLVSPSESEAEESEPIKEPGKLSPKKNHGRRDEAKNNFSLRKTVKQVSFQPSSIHSMRSFSASFPARRASVATSLLLDNAAKKLEQSAEQEGRMEAKQRVQGQQSLPRTEEALNNVENQAENCSPSQSGKIDDSEDIILSFKEKTCWDTYCRMRENGLTVSFDTILRGILTPTEYRLRRKFSMAASDETVESTRLHN